MQRKKHNNTTLPPPQITIIKNTTTKVQLSVRDTFPSTSHAIAIKTAVLQGKLVRPRKTFPEKSFVVRVRVSGPISHSQRSLAKQSMTGKVAASLKVDNDFRRRSCYFFTTLTSSLVRWSTSASYTEAIWL